MSKLRTSIELIKASASVLKQNKKLIILPAMSALLVISLIIIFLLPLFLNGGITGRHGIFSSGNTFIYFYLYYFTANAIIIFFNSVLVKAALSYLKGEETTLGECFSFVFGRIGIVFGYAAISSTVGLILSLIQDKLGLFGKIFSFVANLAWHIITYLTVPILVNENAGPIEAIKRSAALVKKTWGENLIGNIGLGFLFTAIIMALVVLTAPLAIYLSLKGKFTALIIMGVVFVSLVIVVALINSTLSAIYNAVLYRFASEGAEMPGFNKDLMEEAFRKKEKNNSW